MRSKHVRARRRMFLAGVATLLVAATAFVFVPRVERADAAIPIPGGQVTRFEIDGNPDGVYDWNSPYGPLAPSAGYPYQTAGMLPLTFFPKFEQKDFPDKRPVTLPDGTICGTPPTYVDNSIVDGKKLGDVVVDNVGPIVQCKDVLDKGDQFAAYTAYEVVEVPTSNGGTQLRYILYGGWRRDPTATGEVKFWIPLSDGVPGNTADAAGKYGDRMVGFNYSSSSGAVALDIRRWSGTSWVTVGGTLPADAFQGAGTPGFGEFAVDLTLTGILPDGTNQPAQCRTVNTAGYVLSQTGQGQDPSLKDIVLTTPFEISNCGPLRVAKTSGNPNPPAANFQYTFAQRDGAAIFPPASVPSTTPVSSSTQLNDTIGITGTPYPNPQNYTVLAQPDYLGTEVTSLLPVGWSWEGLRCTYVDIFSPPEMVGSVLQFPTKTAVLRANYAAGPDTQFPVASSVLAPSNFVTTCTFNNEVTSLM